MTNWGLGDDDHSLAICCHSQRLKDEWQSYGETYDNRNSPAGLLYRPGG
jgi:hypothetical protein